MSLVTIVVPFLVQHPYCATEAKTQCLLTLSTQIICDCQSDTFQTTHTRLYQTYLFTINTLPIFMCELTLNTWPTSLNNILCVLLAVKKCPMLRQPSNGTMRCTKDDLSYQTMCEFSCNPGFKLVGSRTRTCLAIAFWSGLSAKCRGE